MVFRVVFQNQSQIQTPAHRDTQLAKSELQKKKRLIVKQQVKPLTRPLAEEKEFQTSFMLDKTECVFLPWFFSERDKNTKKLYHYRFNHIQVTLYFILKSPSFCNGILYTPSSQCHLYGILNSINLFLIHYPRQRHKFLTSVKTANSKVFLLYYY